VPSRLPAEPELAPVDGETVLSATGDGSLPTKSCQSAKPPAARTTTSTTAAPPATFVLRFIPRLPPPPSDDPVEPIRAGRGYGSLSARWGRTEDPRLPRSFPVTRRIRGGGRPGRACPADRRARSRACGRGPFGRAPGLAAFVRPDPSPGPAGSHPPSHGRRRD